MHTEVCLRFRSDVHRDRLCAGMRLVRATARRLREMPVLLDRWMAVRHAMTGAETGYRVLVFAEGTAALRLLVCPTSLHSSAAPLLRKTQEIVQRFLDAAAAGRARVASVSLELIAGGALVSVGRRRSFAETLAERSGRSVFGDVVMGAMTFLFTGVLTDAWREAVVVGLATSGCFLLWLAVEAARAHGGYEYPHL